MARAAAERHVHPHGGAPPRRCRRRVERLGGGRWRRDGAKRRGAPPRELCAGRGLGGGLRLREWERQRRGGQRPPGRGMHEVEPPRRGDVTQMSSNPNPHPHPHRNPNPNTNITFNTNTNPSPNPNPKSLTLPAARSPICSGRARTARACACCARSSRVTSSGSCWRRGARRSLASSQPHQSPPRG